MVRPLPSRVVCAALRNVNHCRRILCALQNGAVREDHVRLYTWDVLRFALGIVTFATILGCTQGSGAAPTPAQTPTPTPTTEPAPTLSMDEAFEALRSFIAENSDDRFYREVRNFASFDQGTWFPGVRAWVFVGVFSDDIDDPGFRGLTIIFRVFEDTLVVERLA